MRYTCNVEVHGPEKIAPFPAGRERDRATIFSLDLVTACATVSATKLYGKVIVEKRHKALPLNEKLRSSTCTVVERLELVTTGPHQIKIYLLVSLEK